MEQSRKHLEEGTFDKWKNQMVKKTGHTTVMQRLDWYIIKKFLGTLFLLNHFNFINCRCI